MIGHIFVVTKYYYAQKVLMDEKLALWHRGQRVEGLTGTLAPGSVWDKGSGDVILNTKVTVALGAYADRHLYPMRFQPFINGPRHHRGLNPTSVLSPQDQHHSELRGNDDE
jgi:hypothetical protein